MKSTAVQSAPASTPVLIPGLGLAVCDGLWRVAVVPPQPGKRLPIIRYFDGRMLPGESLEDTVARVLARAGFKTPFVGVSNHDVDLVDTITVAGTHIVPVSPTVATLAGLPFIDDKLFDVLQNGTPASYGVATALLKIGPRRVSWAVNSDDNFVTHRFITPDMVADFSPEAGSFVGYVAPEPPDINSTVQLLGNRGWLNAARYLLEQDGTATPPALTLQLMEAAINQRSIRALVSHICSETLKGNNAFAVQVSEFMSGLIGGAIGSVASERSIGTLYVQCNAMSAVGYMPQWFSGRLNWRIRLGDPRTVTQRMSTRVVLIGPRPMPIEALGASQVGATAA